MSNVRWESIVFEIRSVCLPSTRDETIRTSNGTDRRWYHFDHEEQWPVHLDRTQRERERRWKDQNVDTVPTRSRLGPTSIAFQLKEYFDGHIVKPSWCYSNAEDRLGLSRDWAIRKRTLLVNTIYLDDERERRWSGISWRRSWRTWHRTLRTCRPIHLDLVEMRLAVRADVELQSVVFTVKFSMKVRREICIGPIWRVVLAHKSHHIRIRIITFPIPPYPRFHRVARCNAIGPCEERTCHLPFWGNGWNTEHAPVDEYSNFALVVPFGQRAFV